MASRVDVYAKFGETAEAAQLFETALGTVLLAAKGHHEGWFDGQKPEKAGAFRQKVDRSTLGSLLKACKRELSFGGGGGYEQFNRGLLARNQLFHGFFEKHGVGIQSEVGRAVMIEDLESLHEELFRCWRVAEGITVALLPEKAIGSPEGLP